MSIRLTAACSLTLSLSLLLAGCDGDAGRTGGPLENDAQESFDALNPDPTAEDSAGSAGEVKQPGTDETRPPTPAESVPDDARAQPAGQGAARPADGPPVARLRQRTKEILNARELTNDPNWSVVASDPTQVQAFTATGTVLNQAYALAGTANLEQWIRQEQALNGSYPTYAALKEYVAQNPVDMPALPREYQHYGYDETTGQVVILENRQEKTARLDELGLPADQ